MATGARLRHTASDAAAHQHLAPSLREGRRTSRPPAAWTTDGASSAEDAVARQPFNSPEIVARPMDPLLDAEQAARYLGTGTRFVRRLIAEHRIDYIKLGKYVRLRQSTLDAFIDAGPIPAS